MLMELDGTGPLYRQVYRCVRRAILNGTLQPGARLPATRAVAGDIGVSRNTVLLAFEQLTVEGYVTATTGSGTYVADTLPDATIAVGGSHNGARAGSAADTQVGADDLSTEPAELRVSAAARRLEDLAPRAERLSWALGSRAPICDFRYGTPAFDEVPMETWSRLVGRRMRAASLARLTYSPPGGVPELRSALSAYLRRSRGVRCDPDQVFVTRGTQQAVNLVADVLLDPADRVAIEEPHYFGFELPLSARGTELVRIPTDESGLMVEALESVDPVRLICVTPSHQFPSGSLMPLSRRLELLSAADRMNAAILEDDYDSEFRYDGRPVECLQGLDRTSRVIYAGSASKLMFPSMRIGWLVAPPQLKDAFTRAIAVADTGSATIEQLAFADFVAGGHLERHLRRTRVKNAERRDALLGAVERYFGPRARVSGAEAGVHVIVWLEGVAGAYAPAIRTACRARGVAVYPIGAYFDKRPDTAGFLLGYASPRTDEIDEGIRVFAEEAAQAGS